MDPARKRRLRLIVALGAAIALAGVLVYSSVTASTEASKPSEVRPGEQVKLTGKVVNNSVERTDDGLRFRIRDRDGTESVRVAYTGTVPDPFREGREVIIEGELREGVFVAERDTLVTKCPSKFTKDS